MIRQILFEFVICNMGDSSFCHKGSQENNVAYPRPRIKCLLASNVTVVQQ